MIQVYRNSAEHIQLKPTEGATFSSTLMSENKIVFSSYVSPVILDLQIGDYIIHKGVTYTINTVPNYSKVEHTTDHSYNITFEHPIYKMFDKSFRHEGQSEFTFFGTAADHVQLLVDQMNEIDPGWMAGEVFDTPEQHTSFDGVSCRAALTQIAETFGLEFYFNEVGKRSISLVPNPARTGDLSGWTTNYPEDLSIEKADFFGDQINVFKSVSDGSHQILSEYLPIDPTKAYEFSLWVRNPDYRYCYYGMYTYANEGDYTTVENIRVNRNGTTLVTSNSYFYSAREVIDEWVHIVGYVLPVGFDPQDTLNMGKNNDRNVVLGADSKFIRMRFYNYSPSIPEGTMYFANPRVKEVNPEEIFYIPGKQIDMVANVGVDRNITLQHGKYKGLYNLSRSYVQDKNIVTRLYATGGERNLPESYPYNRLQLPEPLEANIDLYGVKEGEYRNDDIFPTRTGTVTSVTPYDPETKFNKLIDTSLDFDINDHLAPGITAKIGFQDGELAGFEFEITNYDHATKTITYLTNSDTSTGFVLPNETFSAKAGDKYKLFDILLPQAYVDDALVRLEAEAQEHLETVKFPNVAYDLAIDVLHFKRKGYELNPGDRIRVIDTDIHLDEMIRVASVSYPLAFPDQLWTGMQYNAEIANNFIPYTVQERIQIEQREQKKQIKEQSKVSKHTKAAMEEIARAAAIQQFARTYVGQLAILTGALVVGNPVLGAVAGVSGLEDALSAIRFFAGSSFENRDAAPFRVDQAGNLWATKAFIEGVIKASSGEIGGWELTTQGLVNSEDYDPGSGDPETPNPDHDAYIISRRYFRDALGAVLGQASAMIGANVLPISTQLRALGYFENSEPNPTKNNFGLIIDVRNGVKNIALRATGAISNDGFSGSYGRHIFEPTSSVNVIDPANGDVALVHVPGAYTTAFLPTESLITGALGISSNEDFCIQMTIVNHLNSTNNLTLKTDSANGWNFRVSIPTGGVGSIDNIAIKPADSVIVIIQKGGSNKWVYINRNDV